MMGKFTVWVVLAGIAWLGWTLWRIGKRRADSTATPPQEPRMASREPAEGETDAAPPEPILRCAHCGLYLPARESVRDPAGRSFCSTAHRDRGAPPPQG